MFADVRRNQTLQIVKKQTSAADAACGTNDAIRWLVKRRCFEDAVHLGIEAVSQEALLSSTSHNDATSFQPETCFIFSFSGFDVLRRYGALIHPVATLLLTYVRFSKEKKLEAACAFRCLRVNDRRYNVFFCLISRKAAYLPSAYCSVFRCAFCRFLNVESCALLRRTSITDSPATACDTSQVTSF